MDSEAQMRTIPRYFSLILLFLVISSSRDLFSQGWVSRPTLGGALHSALALDSQGKAHVAFSELYRSPSGESIIVIHHGAWEGGHFEFTVVDSGGFNEFVAIAIDQEDRPHITHHSHEDWALRHHYRDGTEWITEIIDHIPLDLEGFGGHEGWSSSITYDSRNHGHISHIDYPSGGGGAEGDSKGILYIYNDGVEWSTKIVKTNPTWVFDGTSIAVNSLDNPSIAYYDSLTRNLMFAVKQPDRFVLSEIDTTDDVGQYADMKYDADDLPRIGYLKRLDSESGIIRTAIFDGAEWIIEDIDTLYNIPSGDGHRSQHMISLEISSTGETHIAYSDEKNLYYATMRESTIEKRLVADYAGTDSTLEGSVWLDLDLSDIPHMAYSVGVATPGIPIGFYVTEVSESPVVEEIPSQIIGPGESFARIDLNDYVTDPDTKNSLITWTFSGNEDLVVVYRQANQATKVKYPAGWFGSENITFTARDPQGNTDSDVVRFTVIPSENISPGEQVIGESAAVPLEPFLGTNYPNPFNPSTTISYGLSQDSWVNLRIFNSLGQGVATLVDEYQSPGFKTVIWNGRDNVGSSVSSGIYIYRMTTGDFAETKKLLLLK